LVGVGGTAGGVLHSWVERSINQLPAVVYNNAGDHVANGIGEIPRLKRASAAWYVAVDRRSIVWPVVERHGRFDPRVQAGMDADRCRLRIGNLPQRERRSGYCGRRWNGTEIKFQEAASIAPKIVKHLVRIGEIGTAAIKIISESGTSSTIVLYL
jgi:hypothetical protein